MALPSELQPDPITVVYRTIREGMLNHQGFYDVLKGTKAGANFIDMSSAHFMQFKDQVQGGDLPEVALFQSAYRMKPYGRNSLSCEIEQAFDLVYTMDGLKVHPLNLVKWQGFVALAHLGIDLGLPGLVRDWNIMDGADDAFGQQQWKRDSVRYVSAFRIMTTLSLSRQFVASQFTAVNP